MGVSTDGILFFGIAYDDYEDDIENAYNEYMDNWTFDDKEGMNIHCSYSYPMYYAYSIEYRNSRGHPLKFTELPTADDDDIDRLRKFCEKHDIPYREPKWYLVSFWEQ